MTYTPRQARMISNISTAKMARLLGIAQSTYTNKETGKSKFTVDEAVNFCRATKLDFAEVNFLRTDCPKITGQRRVRR